MSHLLQPPDGVVRLVIDTDAGNEIDDQFALSWALLSQDRLKIEGVYATPFSFVHHQPRLLHTYQVMQTATESELQAMLLSHALSPKYVSWLQRLEKLGKDPREIVFETPAQGMEKSYNEINLIFEKLGLNPDGQVFRGSQGFLSSLQQPLRSPAVENLIERALSNDSQLLYVVAIGCLTNIVSALLLAPEISERIVVVWTAGYPTHSRRANNHAMNLHQDLLASRFLFDCGVALVYLPGFQVGAQLRLSLPEMEYWVRGKGAIGDYLYWLYTHNPIHAQRGITDHFGRSWVIWDMITIAWLLNPDWVPSELLSAPVLREDTGWEQAATERHLIREAYNVDRDAIFRDFFYKLERAGQTQYTQMGG